ncbi:MAG: aspartate--tRNA ligase [Clostridiales Family XIII bacterium]|jgi:aspartyl-tRNA synthetase|nr:aspartate--tRNA ligase [Clostridiales Family XIII bacterium]
MITNNRVMKRTDYCGTLRASDIGRAVVLNGWVQKSRRLGGLIFTDLRDKTGIVQIVFDEDIPKEVFAAAENLRSEYVIGIAGKIRERESKNAELPTGDIEVLAEALTIYSAADTPPIYIKDDDNVDENLRLKYRYIDLRKLRMQRNLSFRHEVVRITRDYFFENGFTDVETPILIKPTPEGARDYLVPSRIKNGSFYALPQSPQMYKQLLMASGTDRYFQIAKCFRDEDLRADRQPEFTQIDLEMSFVDQDDVIGVQEGYLKRLMKELMDVDVQTPFPRLTYAEAMARYGSDKPDTRFGFELTDISDFVKNSEFAVFSGAVAAGGSVRGINFSGASDKFSRKDLDKLTEAARTYGAKGLAWIRVTDEGIHSSFSKFYSDEEMAKLTELFYGKSSDLILIVADRDKVVFDTLGWLRNELADRLGLKDSSVYDFLWIIDFPLLEQDAESGRFKAMHHPFTMPNPDDLDKLDADPAAVRALAYDIVLNGTELGGGSIRIHDKTLQNRMFEVLGLSADEIENKFGFLLEAFRYGVPPHGGLAYGLDRLVMLLLGEASIRETMAFPKNQAAEDPVSGAPGTCDAVQLEELGLQQR